MNLLWKKSAFKQLTISKKNISGRNNQGLITVYHRGGGCKKKSRIIDFKRYIWNIFAIVLKIEYDPTRNALLALVVYNNGIINYILAPDKLQVGDKIINKENNFIYPGNATILNNVPIGTKIHNLEFFVNRGAQLIRSAGSYSTIISKLNNWSVVKLKSNEFRLIPSKTLVTYGSVSNFQYIYKNFRQAGYYRRKGWRPHVRGVAMNPIDHPHGGGQGKTSGGRPSVTPYGKITKGQPTSVKENKLVIKKRKLF